MPIRTFNKGKFYARDTYGKTVGEYDYNPDTYADYERRGLLATPDDYNAFLKTQAIKSWLPKQSGLAGDPDVDAAIRALGVSNLGVPGGALLPSYRGSVRDFITQYQPEDILKKYGFSYTPTGSVADTSDFMARLTPMPEITLGRTGPGSGTGGYDLVPTKGPQAGMTLKSEGGAGFVNPQDPTFNMATAGSGAGAPQVAQPGQAAPYFYGANVLGKKANDAAVNTLYKAYFGRNASAAELKNWGVSGGADTTVKSLEDFLKSEQIKYKVPQGTGSLTPESFKPTTATTLPTGGTTDTTGTANAMVAGAQTNLAQIMASLTPPETEADKKEQTLLDQMASLVGDQAQKAADQLTAEQSAGLPDLKKQFADINAQILTKIAEYNVLSTVNQNKPITMNSIIGNERAIMNAKAADIGLLQARAQGLQGQITTAQDTVNRAIDLKYSTIEARLNVYQAQLNALQPTLTKEEKIRAQAQQMMIDNQKQILVDRKAAEKDDWALTLKGYTKLKLSDLAGIVAEAKAKGVDPESLIVRKPNGDIWKKPVEKVKVTTTKAPTNKAPTDEVSDFDYARQVMDANPNINDAELKSGLLELVNKKEIKLTVTDINSLIAKRKEKKTIEAEANKPQTFSQNWFKSKIQTARSNDFSNAEIVDYIIKNFDVNELFKTAKAAGYAKWYTGKETDIKRYIESLL